MKLPSRVLITGPSLELQGGVADFIRLLFSMIDSAQVEFSHVVVGKRLQSSAGWKRPIEYMVELAHFLIAFFRRNPDLIHLNPSLNYGSLPVTLALLSLARLFRKKVIIMFHGWDPSIARSMISRSVRGKILNKLLSGAACYLVLSQSFKDQLVQAGFPPNKVNVVPIMVDVGVFNWEVAPQNRPEDKPIHVLFLSRLEKTKGVWLLLEAIEWWQRRYSSSPLECTIAGDGSELRALTDHVAEKGWSSFIRFTGHVTGKHKLDLFKEAQIFVFPSYHPEGFPKVILEAMAASLPIIYTPMGACAEILGPENGIRIDTQELSGETLAKAMWRLHSNPVERSDMATANRELVEKRYDIKIVSEQFISLYRNLMLDRVTQR